MTGAGVPRVLLVDDRPDNLLALRAVLEPLGLELVEASSGEEALRHLLGDEFAVIVLDVQMPVLDGFETARLIKGRERTRHVPIIFLTAISGEPEHYLRGYESGGVDYVYKPFEPEILRAKVSVLAELWARGATIERQRAELAARLVELNRANEALAGQAVELERSNTALERFAAVAGNEVREPLHAVAGLIDLLEQRYGAKMAPEAQLLVVRAAAGTQRAMTVVASLLEYARANTGELDQLPVALSDVVAEAVAELRPSLEAAGGKVLAGDLPEVVGDRRALVRLFANLLDNAIRHRGPTPPEVTITAARARARWRVTVADNGPGVDPAALPRLFTVWGPGLGLAMCRRIVERHGGVIWAEPGDVVGTAVHFELADVSGPDVPT
ncbi:MAG: response regulator [Actinomycetota bacterium]|nr:response regulator [Actinomycetota bacterium]